MKKKIKLSGEQAKTLRLAYREISSLEQIVKGIIEHAADEIARRETCLWEQIHELCGTTEDTHELKVRWISGDVIATPRVSQDDGVE